MVEDKKKKRSFRSSKTPRPCEGTYKKKRSFYSLRSCRGRSTQEDYWSSIPGEILSLIGDKIGSMADCARFGSVCRSWYLVSTSFRNKLGSAPLLMCGTSKVSESIPFLNPASDETLLLDLPSTVGKQLWGSPFGWLITFDHAGYLKHPRTHSYNLLNPFTGAIIQLPFLSDCWSDTGSYFGERAKAFLTASPDSHSADYVVIVMSALINLLAYIKPGHSMRWGVLRLQGCLDFSGVTYFKGELYGLRFLENGALQVLRFQPTEKGPHFWLAPVVSLDPALKNQNPHYSTPVHYVSNNSWRYYLFDLNGQLCLSEAYYVYNHFKIFKIDLSTGNLTPLHSLGGYCLFLENHYCFSYKISYPPAKLFEEHRYAPREFVSNYLFFCDEIFVPRVWDMSRSCKVVIKNISPPHLRYQPFWIVPPIKNLKMHPSQQKSILSPE